MKLLLIEGAPEFGGQARHVYDLARLLTEHGHYVAVACGNPKAISRLKQDGIPYVHMRFRSKFDLMTIFALRRLINNGGFDIVHTHGVRAGLLGRLAVRLGTSCALVHTVHALVEDFVVSRDWAGNVMKHIYRMIDCRLSRITDRIITVSGDLYCRAQQSGIQSDKLVVVHSGVDVSDFDNLPSREKARILLGLPIGCKVVGTLARFTIQKNLVDLILAFKIMCRARDDIYLALIGDGPETEILKQAALESGIDHKVVMPGFIQRAAKVLPAFDCFALSSRWEGHPLSVLEAMAAGLPVVAVNVVGIAETVVDGQTGFVVPPGSPKALAEGILSVLADPTRAEAMGKAARERVESLFSLEKMVNDVESVYHDLITADH